MAQEAGNPEQSPQPVEDYRHRLYAAYASSHFERADSDRADPTFAHDIVRRLPEDRNARILDVGCGSGRLVRLIRAAGYPNVKGIDTSREQVAEAARNGIAGVEQADLFDFLETHRQGFDVIIASDVLEHFEKPMVLQALDRLAHSLASGGLLIARTPNGISPFSGRYRYGDFTHGTIFTPRSLRQILAVTGFTTVRIFPANPVVHGPTSLIRWAIWQVLATVLKGMLVAESGPGTDLHVTQNVVVLAQRTDAVSEVRSASDNVG